MASELDNENNDLEHYGTWVKKDLQSHNGTDKSDLNIDDLEVSDLDFENENRELTQEDDFLNEIDSLDIEEVSDIDSFDLGDIPEMEDDLISPEEEDELISMAEDNWTPEEDQFENISFHTEEVLSEEDLNAAGDFLPGENSIEDVSSNINPDFEETADNTEISEDTASLSLVEKQTLLLEKIESELSTIKNEILDIRSQLVTQKTLKETAAVTVPGGDKSPESEVKGFFDEDDDESIVLTGDELDNIINTAEITAEEGAGISPELSVENEEDPGLSILSTPEIDDKISLEEDDKISLEEDDITLEEEEFSSDEISLDISDFAGEDEISLENEEDLSLDMADLQLDEELSPDNDEISLDFADLELEDDELSPDMADLQPEEETSLDFGEIDLADDELILEDENLPIDLDDLKLEEESVEDDLSLDDDLIEEIDIDSFDIPTEEIDNLVIDLTAEEEKPEEIPVVDFAADSMAADDIPMTEDIDLGDFGIDVSNDSEESDQGIAADSIGADDIPMTEDIDLGDFGIDVSSDSEESDLDIADVEEVSLDDLLGDSGIPESIEENEESQDDTMDFDLDITEIEEADFDEGEIVHIDEELEEIHLDLNEEEDLPPEIEESIAPAEPVSIDLPAIELEDNEAVPLDNSDLPEIEELDDLEDLDEHAIMDDLDFDSDESLTNITESDSEITLDISNPFEMEDFDLDEDINEKLDEVPSDDHSDFELPGTEDIDLNSLEALAVSDVNDSSESDEFEGINEIEEPIEIDLDDIADDVAEEVSEIIDDKEMPDEGDDVIAIDLPEDDQLGESIIDIPEIIEDTEDIDLIEDFDMPEEVDVLEIQEEPEEFSFSQELNGEESEEEKNISEEQDLKASVPNTVVDDHAGTSHLDKNDPTGFKNKIPSETSLNKLPPELRAEIREILTYMDQLLESLPEDKIQEFARSEHFEVYKKIFEELGISN